jgi:hypothetical protein
MRLAIALGALGLSACSTGGGRPRLDRVEPRSVQVLPGHVVEVNLRGSAFDTGTPPQNTVRIGSVAVPGVPSRNNGTLIRFTIPDMMPSRSEAPPAPWLPGQYSIVVTTPKGTSDTLMLTISPPGERP